MHFFEFFLPSIFSRYKDPYSPHFPYLNLLYLYLYCALIFPFRSDWLFF